MKANQTQSSNPKEMNLPKKNKNDNNHIARIFLMPFGCDCRDKRSSVCVCVCLFVILGRIISFAFSSSFSSPPQL